MPDPIRPMWRRPRDALDMIFVLSGNGRIVWES